MSFKSAMAAPLMALASTFALMGCAGDECAKAADRFEECIPAGPGTTSGAPDTAPTCEGLRECQSLCINETDCATLKAVFAGSDSPATNEYKDCVAKCNSMAR
jgi:hypothetical protein